ncbi:Ff.00g020800.m01.CDS01 [Fusarium sp. VM40]|nr:Ff.00g020800.m01.CDS01 [Fusarium sp. VM40]
MAGIKHIFESRYYDKLKLQRVLEKLFPDMDGKFDLKNVNEKWVFYAPEQVTKADLKDAEIISTS